MSVPSADRDDVDLRTAATELAGARELMRDARQNTDRQALASAISKLELASRQIDEVVDRCRGSALAKGTR